MLRTQTMVATLNRCLAFLERDLRTEASYRLSFLWTLLGIFTSAFMFYFMARLLGQANIPQLREYGGSYFAFLLVGIAFTGYLDTALRSFAGGIRRAQTDGTIEAMLMTPTSLPVLALGSSLWGYAQTTLQVLAYLLIGSLVFGVDLYRNVLPALLALLLSIAAFSAIGIIGASVTLVIKRGDPVVWVFGTAASLLGGVFYPVTILPEWLQALARLVPTTYALRALRLALLQGASLGDVAGDLAALASFAVVLTPLGLYSFRLALRRVLRDGTLTHI